MCRFCNYAEGSLRPNLILILSSVGRLSKRKNGHITSRAHLNRFAQHATTRFRCFHWSLKLTGAFVLHWKQESSAQKSSSFEHVFFKHGRTISRCRCWAAIQLSHHLEPSAVQSMGRSMDWTWEDNMVDCLIFCATRTDRRGGHTPFVRAAAETSDPGAEVVKPDPRC